MTNIEINEQQKRDAVGSAFRITMSPHEWSWTQEEQKVMAQYILWLTQEHNCLREAVVDYAKHNSYRNAETFPDTLIKHRREDAEDQLLPPGT